ncbi:Gti1/Pac2 family-domain-containing protein [Mrakia frigida]|uniref:Gti1/Pac2 family protein n=1 Tax=Mrakia frigida TaxID=29902 RepID=UPI003FCC0CD2
MSKATPPFVGIIESTGDALILFEAARRGLLPRITRRLLAKEQAVLIKSGSIFIFDERESGIKRWTDSLIWSPSRIQSNFLLYRETTARADRHHPNLPNRSSKSPRTKRASAALPIRRRRKKGGGWSRPLVGASEQERERELVGSLTGTYRFKEGGLVKKSISIHINGVAQHLVSYYSVEDALSGVLRSPSSFPELASLTIHSAYLDPIHFRFPPKVRVDENGTIRFE